MGPVRGRLALALALALSGPSAAVAGPACEAARPGWTPGTEATMLTEALHHLMSVPAIVLIVATMLALRWRSQWGGLAVVAGWSLWTGIIAFGGAPEAAVAEGCVGSPALFIGLAAAICIATIAYTAPEERSNHKE